MHWTSEMDWWQVWLPLEMWSQCSFTCNPFYWEGRYFTCIAIYFNCGVPTRSSSMATGLKWGVAPQSPIGRARSVEASYCWFHFWISWGYVGCLWITTRPRGVPACGSWFNSERSTYSATAAEEGQRRPTIGGASSCRIRAAGGRSSNNSRRQWRLWLRPPRKDGVRPSRRPQVAVAVGEGVGNMP